MRLARITGVAAVAIGSALSAANGQVQTVVTTDSAALTAALHAQGLIVRSLTVLQGVSGQIGTYENFTDAPVSIRDGIVMSTGNVADLSPLVEVLDPAYQASFPPPRLSSQMNELIAGGTPEFNDYGTRRNRIHNFDQSFDVASIEVEIELVEAGQVQFDFIFGTVEYPVYTNDFTDAFLVFLDGTTEAQQIAFDNSDKPVQVGSSFAGLETGLDVNSAFAAPHGLIHHLTTTTNTLGAGVHRLRFEVGDVNDHILDSAVFITGLRVGTGTPGTHPSDDCRPDYNSDGVVSVQDLFDFVHGWFDLEPDADFDASGTWGPQDIFTFLGTWFAGCA